MMRKILTAGIALLTVAISSCDNETLTLGDSLTDSIDKFTVVSQSFTVDTKSIKADSVLATSEYKYLGRIKDPETGAYISSDYSTQFHILENESSAIFPDASIIVNRDANDQPIADSCEVRIMVNAYQGDSLAAMKLTLYEMATPLKNSNTYYTDFDPEEEGYLRREPGAVYQNKFYTITDLTKSDSLRNILRQSTYYEYITVSLNKPYTDKEGVTYNNYGTYLMRKYYSNQANYLNSTNVVRNVCPGFYIKTTDGLGVMIEVAYTQLIVHYHYLRNGESINGARTFNSTEEVLQTTHITNDRQSIANLVDIDTCTILKTPAGIFTEVTFPVLKIKETDDQGISHANDTIVSSRITFQRMKSSNSTVSNVLEEPTNLLLIPRDSLYSFFEHKGLPDNKLSYLATYSSTQASYAFNNITNLINHMYANRHSGSDNWNKAVLVPVQLTTTSASVTSTTTSVAAVDNEMSISSVRLVGGTANKHIPVTINITYNKNK